MAAWDEQQTRANFDAVSRLVVPGWPLASPLLRYPLGLDGETAGMPLSAEQHQTIAAWISGASIP